MIRLATGDDAEDILEIYEPIVRETAISFEGEVPSLSEIRRRIEATLSDGYPWLVAVEEGRIVGYAYAGRFRARAAYDWCVEVSVYVRPSRHRRGVGRTLYTTLLRLLERQGFRGAYAMATAPNPGSEGLHRALGFELVGRFPRVGYKHGAWHDVICWYRSLGPQDSAPGAIRRLFHVWDGASRVGRTQGSDRHEEAL